MLFGLLKSDSLSKFGSSQHGFIFKLLLKMPRYCKNTGVHRVKYKKFKVIRVQLIARFRISL